MRSCQSNRAKAARPHGLLRQAARSARRRLGVSIETRLQTFERGDRHVIERGLRFNCRADALLRRQVLAAACADADMRIDALAGRAHPSVALTYQGSSAEIFVMLRGILGAALVRHPILAGIGCRAAQASADIGATSRARETCAPSPCRPGNR